jgi:pimeloyl-ACP methyl ester carboxylesterase
VLWREITAKARAGAMDEARQLWWQHPLFATTRSGAASAALYQSIMAYSGAQWVHDNQKLMLPDVERLHALQARTLLLTGGRDLEDFRLIADVIEASAPDVTRTDWPAYGHLLPLEDPAGCVREICSFLLCAY